nr:hypothetical protein CFP56_16504 [Quercus suber]POF04893.1 hypothetical protein CFP56_73854 [Quercus suber]
MNELEAHEGSYDHQHRKRMKDMKALMRDSAAPAKREAERRAEEKATGMRLNITSSDAGSSAPVRKAPVFKKIGSTQGSSGPGDGGVARAMEDGAMQIDGGVGLATKSLSLSDDPTQAKGNGWYEERYRPELVMASKRCGSGCDVCRGQDMVLETTTHAQFDGRGVEPASPRAWRQWWRD